METDSSRPKAAAACVLDKFTVVWLYLSHSSVISGYLLEIYERQYGFYSCRVR
jgi:hypothetical protein